MRTRSFAQLAGVAVLLAVGVSMLAGIPAAIGLARHLVDTSRTTDLVSLITLRFLATSFVVAGFVVIQRLPTNPIGGLLLGAGVGFTTYFAATELALAAILVDGNVETAWLSVIALSWPLVIGAISLTLLALTLFPDGRLLNRWWLAAIAVLATGYVLSVFDYLMQDTLQVPVLVFFDNPYQLLQAGDTARAIIGGATAILGVASITAASAALVLRYWRGTAEVRQQLRLIGLATIVIFIVITIGAATPDHPLTTLADGLAFSLIPVAMGVGILKHPPR